MNMQQRGELRNFALMLADERISETELDFAVRWSMAKEETLRSDGHAGLAGIMRELRRLAELERDSRHGGN